MRDYSHTSGLIGFRIHQTLYLSRSDEEKDVSALGACSGSCLVLLSLGTCHKFRNKVMTSTKVLLYCVVIAKFSGLDTTQNHL